MKVLVTGATGFVGSFVAERFLTEGFEVRCVVRQTSNLRWLKDKPFEVIFSDFRSAESLKSAVENVDFVVHVAGTIAARNYEGYLAGNRDLTKKLLDAVSLFNPTVNKFIYISSQTALGPADSLENPPDENSPCRPITRYGKSKREGELVVLDQSNRIPNAIVRLPAIYGPRDTALVDMFRLAHKGLAPIIGFSSKFVSLLFVDDAVDGIFRATTNESATNEIFNLSSKKFYSWDELMTVMGEVVGRKVLKLRIPHLVVYTAGILTEFANLFSSKAPVFNFEKARDFTTKYWILNSEKARRLLGFDDKISPSEGFRLTYSWYLENGWI